MTPPDWIINFGWPAFWIGLVFGVIFGVLVGLFLAPQDTRRFPVRLQVPATCSFLEGGPCRFPCPNDQVFETCLYRRWGLNGVQ